MVIYRPNRGGLAEAMENAREFENFDEMKRHVVDEHEETWGRKAFEFDDIVIEETHGEDRRIGWKDCRYVCVKRYLWDEYKMPMCIGQCATDYPGLEQSEEMCRKFLSKQRSGICFNCKHFQLTDGSFDGGYGECQKAGITVILEQRCITGDYEER